MKVIPVGIDRFIDGLMSVFEHRATNVERKLENGCEIETIAYGKSVVLLQLHIVKSEVENDNRDKDDSFGSWNTFGPPACRATE